jgi:uncharacterized paraquat-inducible protein A
MITLKKNNNFDRLFFIFFVIIVPIIFLQVVILIMLYNHTVNLRHETALMGDELQKINLADAAIKTKMFGLLDQDAVDSFATEHNLIKEENPNYISLEKSWEYALR